MNQDLQLKCAIPHRRDKLPPKMPLAATLACKQKFILRKTKNLIELKNKND